MANAQAGAGQRIDVLIVTAVPEEYAAVLAVDTGAVESRAWEARKASIGLAISVRPFVAASGGILWIAVTQALGMGGVEAVSAAAPLVPELGVRCLAMCGVCAGRRGDVALGDVIIADRMWTYDTGKSKVEVGEDGRPIEKERGDIEMYRLAPPAWKQDAERFAVDPGAAWLAARPRSFEAQGDWVLERVLAGVDPLDDVDSKVRCADLDKVLARLWKKKLLKNRALTLTAAGKKHIEHVLLVNRKKLPERAAFRTHVGPIASGSKVMEDAGIFDQLAKEMRKVLGLEMEAAAIGGLAWARGVEYAVVMKGVMDHADPDKSDNFKAFAAQASAECLIAFVRAHLPVMGEGEDEILVTGTSPLPEKAGPAALLNARHEVVGFVGREELLGEIGGWCEAEGRVGARLIHAAGGMGKTRLVIELCKRMRASGWRAGFVPKGLGVDRFATLVGSAQPVVAVIDYAESRPDLRELLEVAAARRGEKSKKKLRLVLLARNGDAWWTDLLRSDGPVKDLLIEEDPIRLPAVSADRETLFVEAVRALAEARHKLVPEGAVPSLSDGRYERALYVHMAALAAVEGRPVNADALMGDTLDHEERFWREQLRQRGREGERVALDKMRRAVSALTLIGGVDSAEEAHTLAGEEGIALLLRDLYPGSATQRISGLEPDLLGEAMVWRVLSKESAGAGPYLDRVFEGAAARAIRTGFEVLGRLSADHKEADGWIARVLGRDVAGRAMDAFAAVRSVGERTAHAGLGLVLAEALEREGTIAIAERLEAALPHPERTVSLREVGRWVLATRLAHLPEDADEERARLLNNLSVWQNVLGQREAALASTLAAVALRRRLAEARPDAFLRDLARSLGNLSVDQKALGQREAALVSTQEAVALFRRLGEVRPDAVLPDLAASLSNLGLLQSALGQCEAALASTDEAVTLRRRLADARPDAFLPDLAASLNNLGTVQSVLGQREAALASTKEAVALRRRLAETRPDAFLPALATSLNNLGAMQGDLDQREAALASTLEALVFYGRLAEARPEAFLPGLAMSINNVGNRQSDLGQREAALASTLEAVALYHRLAEARPDAFLPDLAETLHNLSLRQNALAQPEPALASAQQALDAYWPFFLAHPAAFASGTGRILRNLLALHTTLGRPPPAELLARRAVLDAHLAP